MMTPKFSTSAVGQTVVPFPEMLNSGENPSLGEGLEFDFGCVEFEDV